MNSSSKSSFDTFAYHWSTNNYDSEIKIFTVSSDLSSEQNVETICVRVANFYRYFYVLSDNPYSVINYIERNYNRRERDKNFVVTCFVTERHSFYDYECGKKLYVQCRCRNRAAAYRVVEQLKLEQVNLSITGIYEQNTTDVCQFVSTTNLPTAGWIRIRDSIEITDENHRVSNCDREFLVRDARNQMRACERYDRADLKILSFDIEVNSQTINTFPCNRADDAIFQISGVISGRTTGAIERKYLLTLRGVDVQEMRDLRSENRIDVREFDDEIALIRGFFDLIDSERPNVVTGYNLFGFDIGYILARCKRFMISDSMFKIGYLKRVPKNPVKEIAWSSSAFSNQEFLYVDWSGILVVDLLPVVRNILQMKLSNFKLDTVSAHVLDEGKDPVNYKEIFQAYASKRFARVGKYCVRDSELCARIVDKCFVMPTLCELARASNVPIVTLYTQGQQIRVFSNVYKYCSMQDIVVNQRKNDCGTVDFVASPDDADANEDEKYAGATVFSPVPGMYGNVVPFDFSSLYPSIMISNNICPTTLKADSVDFDENLYQKYSWSEHVNCEHDENVISRDSLTERINSINDEISTLKLRRDSIDSCFAKLVGSSVSRCKFEIQKQINALRKRQTILRDERKECVKRIGSKSKICGDREFCFLKSTVRTGILPKISRDLIESRKQVRKMYESEKDESKRAILNARQLALKITANSVYGSAGAKNGYLPCMPCAMTVTYIGRESVVKSSKYISERFGGKLIYGDTDSNYFTFPHHSVEKDGDLWSFVESVAEETSSLFPKPMKLEFEGKIYEKFIIFAKKRYITKELYASGKVGLGYRGVILVRRDNCEYLRDMYLTIVKKIFDDRELNEIFSIVSSFIDDIFRKCVDDEKFVITKAVKDIGKEDDESDFGDYKVRKKIIPSFMQERQDFSERQYHLENSGCPGQLVLADKMRRRGTPVDAGARLEYVVLDDGSCNSTKISIRMEDFDYYKTNRRYLKIDHLHYLKTFVQPIDQLLNVALGVQNFLKNAYLVRKRYAECCRRISNRDIRLTKKESPPLTR